jgi:hypothetical protein
MFLIFAFDKYNNNVNVNVKKYLNELIGSFWRCYEIIFVAPGRAQLRL